MPYSDKVIDHYENPRNVGSLPKDDPNVGTGLVGAPECGDVMKLQIKVKYLHSCVCGAGWDSDRQESACKECNGGQITITDIINDAKFKTFGCGSAIASSSLATEWLKGKTIEEASKIKNTQIVQELSLPPVKVHCSVLAEDAIKAAIKNYKDKKETKPEETPKDSI